MHVPKIIHPACLSCSEGREAGSKDGAAAAQSQTAAEDPRLAARVSSDGGATSAGPGRELHAGGGHFQVCGRGAAATSEAGVNTTTNYNSLLQMQIYRFKT